MTALFWYPEKFNPTGNMTSEGVKKQLGRSQLDPLTLLIRETVQNSWDAGLPDKTVRYLVHCYRLTAEQKRFLRNNVFQSYPPNIAGFADLWNEDKDTYVLAIADRNTSGLTGPSRADQVHPDSEERDFVDFLLNVGQPRNTHLGGGTYGYGKSVLYVRSNISTILVHSHTTNNGKHIKRFCGACLGGQYDRHTGRHWWGEETDNCWKPLEGEPADAFAKALGFPEFKDGETGTTNLVLMPDLGVSELDGDETLSERTPKEAAAFIVSALLWNFWPKMVKDSAGKPQVEFEVYLDKERIPVPSPETHPLLYGYCAALKNLLSVEAGKEVTDTAGNQLTLISSRRPIKDLGWLSIVKTKSLLSSINPVSHPETAAISELIDYLTLRHAPSVEKACHVALMRDARLVVRYQQGPVAETGEYVGVFKTLQIPEVDAAFAAAEPPAHEDWVSQGLPPHQSRLVNVALKRVEEQLSRFAGDTGHGHFQREKSSLGQISSHLASLIPVVSGTGHTSAVARISTEELLRRQSAANSARSDSKPEKKRPSTKSSSSDGGSDDGGTSSASQTGSHETGHSAARPVPRPSVNLSGDGELVEHQGKRAFRVPFIVNCQDQKSQGHIEAIISVNVMDGFTLESDPPIGAEKPEVIGWIAPDQTQKFSNDKRIAVSYADNGNWSILVGIPDDTEINVTLKVA